jgi:hypothetical protein
MTDIPRPTPASALGCIVKRYAGSRHAFRWHLQAVQAHLLAPLDNGRDRVRVIGMDIHRSFAQVAILQDGQIAHEMRADLVRVSLVNFAKPLCLEEEIVMEATGNSAAVERLIRPHVKRVAVANSCMVRAIAYARVKTDASILARLHAAGFLPEVWISSEGPRGLEGGRSMDLNPKCIGVCNRQALCRSYMAPSRAGAASLVALDQRGRRRRQISRG